MPSFIRKYDNQLIIEIKIQMDRFSLKNNIYLINN